MNILVEIYNSQFISDFPYSNPWLPAVISRNINESSRPEYSVYWKQPKVSAGSYSCGRHENPSSQCIQTLAYTQAYMAINCLLDSYKLIFIEIGITV